MNYCKFTLGEFKRVSKFPIKLWEEMSTLYIQLEARAQKLIAKNDLEVPKNHRFYLKFLKSENMMMYSWS